MVDFRYHLISLVAVFLALGVGILMGSVVLDQQLVAQLRKDVRAFDQRNDRLQQELDVLDQRLGASTRFADEASGWLLAGALAGRTVVMVEIEGTEDGVVGDVRDSIETAGGEVTGTVMLTDRFALTSVADRDELALAIRSTSERARDLRAEAGALIGNRMAAAAAEAGTTNEPRSAARQRLGGVLVVLEQAGFVSADTDDPELLVPPATVFLVVGGAQEEATWDASSLTLDLVRGFGRRGAPAMVAEPSFSGWGLVPVVRGDAEAAGEIATVDQAETQEGRIAIVLGLERAYEGSSGHYGIRDGASEVLPEPPQG